MSNKTAQSKEDFLKSDAGLKMFDSIATVTKCLRAMADTLEELIPKAEAPTATAAGEIKKRKRDPNAPKPPFSLYLRFVNRVRPQISQKVPTFSQVDILKLAASMWKKLSDDDKRDLPDCKLYEEEAAEYRIAKKAYDDSKKLRSTTKSESPEESDKENEGEEKENEEEPEHVPEPAPKKVKLASSEIKSEKAAAKKPAPQKEATTAAKDEKKVGTPPNAVPKASVTPKPVVVTVNVATKDEKNVATPAKAAPKAKASVTPKPVVVTANVAKPPTPNEAARSSTRSSAAAAAPKSPSKAAPKADAKKGKNVKKEIDEKKEIDVKKVKQETEPKKVVAKNPETEKEASGKRAAPKKK